MRVRSAARLATALAIAIGGIVAACHNDVPPPAVPTPLTPEVSRESPKPQPIDTKRKAKPKRVSQAPDAPTDAGVSDTMELPPVPDATVIVVRDAGQPLK
jgi:hypothetical protein